MKLFSKSKIDASHINIKLKPILGIKPEKYIPAVFLIILTILFFLQFLLPGLINNGSMVTITTTPPGASVWIDDQRVGSSPVTTFVKKGKRDIKIKKDNFITLENSVKVKGRLFLSLLFKRKEVVNFNMYSTNGNEILSTGYNNMANWSLIPNSEISSRFRTPDFLSESISDYYYSSDYTKEEAKQFLYSSIKLVTNQYILSDYLRSFFIVNSEKKMNSISSLKKTLLDLSKVRSKSQNVEMLLYDKILNDVNFNIQRHQKIKTDAKKILDNTTISYESSIADRKINDYIFLHIPESSIIPLAGNFIHPIKEESFYISNRMITTEDYQKFLLNNKKWSLDNLDMLIEDDLVDRFYLDIKENNAFITNVSYHAAKAWIEWANKTWELPNGYKLALPTENQWLSATQYDTFENIEQWHWTSQGYYIYDHFLADNDGQFIDEFSFVEPRLVVGNKKYNNMDRNPRGVQKANWCTPFLGFRPVLIKE